MSASRYLLLFRLFGLKDIIVPGNCSAPFDLNLNTSHDWPVYVNPGILFLLYMTIVTVLKSGFNATAVQVSSRFWPLVPQWHRPHGV